MSSLARISLRNRGLTALIAILAIGFGVIAIPKLKQQLFPSLEFPAAVILATYPGAAPDIVDRQVTGPISTAVQGVPGLKTTTATSREGSAMVLVEFDFGTDLDQAVAKTETALGRLRAQLPDGVDPTVLAGSTADMPVVVLAASSGTDERQLAEKLRSSVLPDLQSIEGVREATLTGARDQVVVITPDLGRLAASGADVGAIAATLRGNGVAAPTGTVTQDARSLTVQVGTAYRDLDDLRNLYLVPGTASGSPGAGSGATGTAAAATRAPVRLGDVAEISEQLAPPTSITRTDGRPSLGISVTATPSGNAVQISDQIREALPELEAEIGGDAQLTAVFDQAPYVKRSIKGLAKEGTLGLVFAVLVILLFLFSVRSTIVTAVSIPLSVVIALITLWGGDYSLNILTLGALTIAVGRVVDDSIVVLENIKRHLEYGEDKAHAVVTAVREVAGAVTASTVTTVGVFAPIALVGGIVGELFESFAVTIAVALLASLLVSLTVIPVLAYWFLKPATGNGASLAEIRSRADQKERRSLLQRAYVPVIGFATRRRVATLLAGIVVFVGTVGLAATLKTNFFDQSGQNSVTITQKLPVGTSLAATDAATKAIEEILADSRDIETYQTTIGGGGIYALGGGPANEVTFSLTVAESADAAAVQRRLRDRFAGLDSAGEIKVTAGSGGHGFSADALQVIVEADDPAVLSTATERVRAAMADTKGVREVESDLSSSVPRIEVALKREAAGRYGLSDTAVSQTVAAALRGSPLGQVTLGGSPRAVTLRLGAAPASLAQIQALPLVTGAGPVPLGQVAEVRQVEGPVQVTRIDGVRSATVSGTAEGSNVGKITQALTAALEKVDLPKGASYRLAGVSSDQQDAFADLGMALLAAIAIVYIVMAVTFRSLVQPLILLVSIPFAATGAIGLLLATGTALGVPALIGMLMLVGIVVTNAIVLLDLINKYRESGMGVVEAVVEGGRHRLRPILMTAIATICALTPMALGTERSSGFISQPLAIVVIGGLISSTVLTLILVPTLYTLVEHYRERRALRRQQRRNRTGAAAPAPRDAAASDPAGTDGSAPRDAAASDPAGTGGSAEPAGTAGRDLADPEPLAATQS